MTTALLRAEIQATQALTQKPFGVNLIVMHPDLDALIEVCGEEGVGCVVLAGGIPPRKAMRRVKELGRHTDSADASPGDRQETHP